jgi:hypothetical protein
LENNLKITLDEMRVRVLEKYDMVISISTIAET